MSKTEPREVRFLHELIERQAERRPAAPALLFGSIEFSYADLWKSIQSWVGILQTVGKQGDCIGVLAWNSPQFVGLLYAIPAAGRIAVPLNARLAKVELYEQCARTDMALLLMQDSLRPGLDTDRLPSICVFDPVADPEEPRKTEGCGISAADPDATVWVLFTSGTTGKPKGAMLSHGSILAALESARIARHVEPLDRYLYPFPLFHVSAHNVLLQHRFGAAVVLMSSFDAEAVLELCRRKAVNTMSLAPTMLSMLLEQPGFDWDALRSIRAIGYGASAIAPSVLRQVCKNTSVSLSGGYGMTELSGSVAFLDAEAHRRGVEANPELLSSVGQVVPGVELRLRLDTGEDAPTGKSGEILVRGPQLMKGYWRDHAATESVFSDGWLCTGDVGRLDDSGNLYIVDRKKDMIVSGGENVASREVEDILIAHPAVSQAAVVGVPHARWGEQVAAAVVVLSSHNLEAVELLEFCRDHLAGYKIPRTFLLVEKLPVNASGKVDKVELRRSLQQEAEQ